MFILNNKKVLIITMELDPHADVVIDEIRNRGYEVFRLNTEKLLIDYKFDVFYEEGILKFEFEDSLGRKIKVPDEIISIYYRKPKKPMAPPVMSNDIGLQQYVISEARELLNNLYNISGVRWINNPNNIKKAQIKLSQLEVARSLGLSIPNTIVTNRMEFAKKFIEDNKEIACKALITTTAEINGKTYHLYTSKLDKNKALENIENVEYSPTCFQKYIRKYRELRVTIIGDNIFCCEIDSQILDKTKNDWRTVDPSTIPHKIVDIPESIKNSLYAFLKYYDLTFGAFDLIKTENNDYVFLENNPNGQWYWIEMLTGAPMAKAMANHLLKNV